MYLIIVGGGHVGFQLAKKLIAKEHEVLLIEKNRVLAQQLAMLLGEDHVTQGDGCEVRLQKEVGFGRADIVIAVTGEDEDNLIICQMAKVFWNVSRVVARVSNPTNDEVFHSLDIDHVISATGIIFSLIEQHIEMDELLSIGLLAKGQYEVTQILIASQSPALNQKAQDLPLPSHVHLVWFLRGTESQPISPNTRLEEGDIFAAIGPKGKTQELRDFLCPL